MPPSNKRRILEVKGEINAAPNKHCILKCSNVVLIRKFTWNKQRLVEESLKRSYFILLVYGFTPHGLINMLLF